MTDSYTIDHFERELKYWQQWVEHEEKVLEGCPEETKPYITVRLAMGVRNILEIEKALSVLKPSDGKPKEYPQINIEELVKDLG
jgi:hypothetical protein